MDKSELSLSEKLYFRLKSLYLANRLPFISAMLAGFAAQLAPEKAGPLHEEVQP